MKSSNKTPRLDVSVTWKMTSLLTMASKVKSNRLVFGGRKQEDD
jgi:hypothetical protein